MERKTAAHKFGKLSSFQQHPQISWDLTQIKYHVSAKTSPCQMQLLQPESLLQDCTEHAVCDPRKVGTKSPLCCQPLLGSHGSLVHKVFEVHSGWCFQLFFIFTPKIGEDDPIWWAYFSDGLVQPPTSIVFTWRGNDVKHPLSWADNFKNLQVPATFCPQLFLLFLAVFHHGVSPSFSGIPYIWLLAQSLARFDLLHFDTIAFCRYESNYDPLKSWQSLTWINHLTFHQIQWLLPRLENPWGVAL